MVTIRPDTGIILSGCKFCGIGNTQCIKQFYRV